MDKVTEGCRKLHNEEFHNMCSSPSIKMTESKLMRYVAHMSYIGNALNILFGKLEGRKPLRKPKHRWEDNIMMDLGEVGWEGMDWIYVAQDRDW